MVLNVDFRTNRPPHLLHGNCAFGGSLRRTGWCGVRPGRSLTGQYMPYNVPVLQLPSGSLPFLRSVTLGSDSVAEW